MVQETVRNDVATLTKQVDLLQVYLCHIRQFLFQIEIKTNAGMPLINRKIVTVFHVENCCRLLTGVTLLYVDSSHNSLCLCNDYTTWAEPAGLTNLLLPPFWDGGSEIGACSSSYMFSVCICQRHRTKNWLHISNAPLCSLGTTSAPFLYLQEWCKHGTCTTLMLQEKEQCHATNSDAVPRT